MVMGMNTPEIILLILMKYDIVIRKDRDNIYDKFN